MQLISISEATNPTVIKLNQWEFLHKASTTHLRCKCHRLIRCLWFTTQIQMEDRVLSIQWQCPRCNISCPYKSKSNKFNRPLTRHRMEIWSSEYSRIGQRKLRKMEVPLLSTDWISIIRKLVADLNNGPTMRSRHSPLIQGLSTMTPTHNKFSL